MFFRCDLKELREVHLHFIDRDKTKYLLLYIYILFCFIFTSIFVSSTNKDGQKETRNTRQTEVSPEDTKEKRRRVNLEVSHVFTSPDFI